MDVALPALLAVGWSHLVAHQGGWDELLYVLAPLVLVAGLLVTANRRAKRLLAEQQPSAGPPPAERPDGGGDEAPRS
jgi:hypothetical protein